MSTENVRIARRWFDEVWNQRRTETIDELLTPESISYSEAGPLRGPEEFKTRMHAPFLEAFPDLTVTVEDTLAEGDRVAVRWVASGTHTGEGLGLPPTGRRVEMRGITWVRYEGGKMIEGWDCWNHAGLVQALAEA